MKQKKREGVEVGLNKEVLQWVKAFLMFTNPLAILIALGGMALLFVKNGFQSIGCFLKGIEDDLKKIIGGK